MAVSTQVIRFTKEVTGVTNVTQDVALNFTPKAIIVFSDCATGDNSAAAHYQWSHGFSDGTNSRCITITSDDADAAADTQTVNSGDSVYVRMNETSNATVLERATCAFITNAVRFTWAVASTTATRICIWAFGGDDITNVKVGDTTVSTSVGTVDYTGLGFNPTGDQNSVLFTLSTFAALSNTSVSHACSHFGCATSASKEWAISNVMEDTRDPSDTWRAMYTDKCLIFLGGDSGLEEYTAEFSAWITDGFRLNWVNPSGSASNVFSYMVVNGGTWDVGNFTAPVTPTNDVDTAVSVSSFPIKGLLLSTISDSAVGTPLVYAMGSIGATDGTNQAAIGFIDEDGQATMDSYRVNTAASVVRVITTDGASQHTATIDSFTTNNFRLDWSATNAGIVIVYVVVADSSTAAAVVEQIPAKSFGIIGYTNTIGTQTMFGGGGGGGY